MEPIIWSVINVKYKGITFYQATDLVLKYQANSGQSKMLLKWRHDPDAQCESSQLDMMDIFIVWKLQVLLFYEDKRKKKWM